MSGAVWAAAVEATKRIALKVRAFTDGSLAGFMFACMADSPSYLILRKVFEQQGLGLYFGGKFLILKGCACKVLIRDEKERGSELVSIFEPDLIVADWRR